MKSSLIRILTIMTLASSISAFAGSNKPADPKKTNSDKANCEATAAPSNASSKAGQSDAQSDEEKEKSERKRLIEQQNKQWLHDVQNIVAG